MLARIASSIRTSDQIKETVMPKSSALDRAIASLEAKKADIDRAIAEIRATQSAKPERVRKPRRQTATRGNEPNL